MFVNSLIPASDNSLPYPDSLIPPKGNLGSDRTKSLTKQDPASIWFNAISSPFFRFFVKTAPPNPNWL